MIIIIHRNENAIMMRESIRDSINDLANEQVDNMTKTTPVLPLNNDTKSRVCFVLHVLVYICCDVTMEFLKMYYL